MRLKWVACRVALALACLLSLGLWGQASPARAADQFLGAYQGIYLGYGFNTGNLRHYCLYGAYTVDGAGSFSRGEYRNTEGLGLQLTTADYDYSLFRREGVLVGTDLAAASRAHVRLRDDLEAGFSLPMNSSLDWYFGLFGLQYSGPDLEASNLTGEYWAARSGYTDDGDNQSHWAGFGTETYDGVDTVTVSISMQDELHGTPPGNYSTTYTLSSSGGLTRGTTQQGFYLDDGDLLIVTDVSSAEHWYVEFSLRKPTPGSAGAASLQGSYWLGYSKVEDAPPVVGNPFHAAILGKMYFDGVGTATYQVTINRSDGADESKVGTAAYTVDANGRLEIAELHLVGGISQDGHTVIGAGMYTDTWGLFALLKSSGIEDPSPLCHVVGLTP